MASIQISISKRGGNDAHVIFRVAVTRTFRPKVDTGIVVPRKYWSESKCALATGGKSLPAAGRAAVIEQNTLLNKRVADLKTLIESSLPALDVTAETTTASAKEWLAGIIDRYNYPDKYAPKVQKPKTLKEIINDAQAQLQETGKINGQVFAAETLKGHKSRLKRWQDFIKSTGRDWETDEVNADFYNLFLRWCDKQGLKNGTRGALTRCLKSILRKCMPVNQQGNCEFLMPRRCKVLVDDSAEIGAVALNELQLDVMARFNFSGVLERARDMFLLLAWTGQRFSDLHKLTAENLKEKDGMRYFLINQQKTNNLCAIPVLEGAAAVLAKYDEGKALPRVISNQKFNQYLREVCRQISLTDEGKQAGFADIVTHKYNNGTKVEKEFFWQAVSAHTARRTFCTISYDRRMPIAQIMQVSGHKSQDVFFLYIRKQPEDMHARSAAEFLNLWQK